MDMNQKLQTILEGLNDEQKKAVEAMEELKKIARVISRELPDASVETLLVLDATTGQNAVNQAKLFNETAEITGIFEA